MVSYDTCLSLPHLFHLVLNVIVLPSFLLVCMYPILYTHSSVLIHLGCFHVLTIVHSAAMNIGVHLSFFFLNLFIYFNWRLITLQYCSGFCHTLTWNSHGCTCVPHPEPPAHLPPHLTPHACPQCTGFEFPVSCIELGYISHMYVCFSAILSNHPPLAFSHRVQKFVLYICVSFAVSHIGSSLPSF